MEREEVEERVEGEGKVLPTVIYLRYCNLSAVLFPHCGLPLVLGPAPVKEPSDYCVCVSLFRVRCFHSKTATRIGLKICQHLPVRLMNVMHKKILPNSLYFSSN